jgi:hypothetical protein
VKCPALPAAKNPSDGSRDMTGHAAGIYMWRKLENDIGALQTRFDGDIRAWTEGYVSRGGHIYCAVPAAALQ